MAEQPLSSDRRTASERRKSERREHPGSRAGRGKFEIPTIMLNAGFILIMQLVVIFAFCN